MLCGKSPVPTERGTNRRYTAGIVISIVDLLSLTSFWISTSHVALSLSEHCVRPVIGYFVFFSHSSSFHYDWCF